MMNVATSQNFTTPTLMCNIMRCVEMKLKNCQILEKTTTKHEFSSFFKQYTPLIPKNSKKELKIKSANFLQVIIWDTLHTRIFRRLMLQQIIMSLEFFDILVCHWHNVNMSATFPTKEYDFVLRSFAMKQDCHGISDIFIKDNHTNPW